jgi:hypothetical protein
VVSEDDVDSSAGRGGRGSGRLLRPQAFAMGGFDSGAYSPAYILSYHFSHVQSREASTSRQVIAGGSSDRLMVFDGQLTLYTSRSNHSRIFFRHIQVQDRFDAGTIGGASSQMVALADAGIRRGRVKIARGPRAN